MPDDTPPVTLIRSADVVVAWDARAKSHVYLSDADVAFQGGALIFAGRGFTGPADRNDRRSRPDGHAWAGEHPLASVERADEQRPDR